MGMFGKAVSTDLDMKRVDNEAISSIIDKDMTITGEVSFKGKTRIDGTVNGNIDGEHLILSENGKVIGDIHVSSFNCYGSLQGNVTATMLTARKNCTIIGKLEASSLNVEPGASIEGEIKAAAELSPLEETKDPTDITVETTAAQ
jgi:cytoskeletal protein CcmA (bactofilin family)